MAQVDALSVLGFGSVFAALVWMFIHASTQLREQHVTVRIDDKRRR